MLTSTHRRSLAVGDNDPRRHRNRQRPGQQHRPGRAGVLTKPQYGPADFASARFVRLAGPAVETAVRPMTPSQKGIHVEYALFRRISLLRPHGASASGGAATRNARLAGLFTEGLAARGHVIAFRHGESRHRAGRKARPVTSHLPRYNRSGENVEEILDQS